MPFQNEEELREYLMNHFSTIQMYDYLRKLQPLPKRRRRDRVGDEWVAIGSGKTLVHKDKFNRVKWTSHTVATRTLLLAIFPRRILATRNLKGIKNGTKKRLDPKIISDIISEIMSRFNVRVNEVRAIITIKCADESKILKAYQETYRRMNERNNMIR
ncbi:hypothetical protein PYW08_005140 [Mythimna loreyi]|uniref:Uncharacterized protein n=1 Tax=Mythimna loreyi TaxID=667449 RepID=A0ACC2QGP5_9NEOP|nr:hypothetical protein PYW08_005140 [Mythimna loreyi]